MDGPVMEFLYLVVAYSETLAKIHAIKKSVNKSIFKILHLSIDAVFDADYHCNSDRLPNPIKIQFIPIFKFPKSNFFIFSTQVQTSV